MPLITTPTPDRAFGSRPEGGSTGARSHITQPALVKIVGSEELPTAVHVDASPAATRSSAASEPSPNDLAAPTPVGPPPTAPVPSVVAVNKIADSGPGVSQSLRTMSAAPEAAAAPSAVQASVAAPPDAPQQPAEVAPTVESKVVVPSAQPDLVRPTKLSRKTPSRAADDRGVRHRPGIRQSSDTCLWRSGRRARSTDGRSDRLKIGRLGDSVRGAKVGGGSQGDRRAAQRQIRPGAQRRDNRFTTLALSRRRCTSRSRISPS